MRTLVIGGTGFLSGAVMAECLAQGHMVSVVTRGQDSRPALPPGVEALRADRTKPDELWAALGNRTFDLVVDCVLFRPNDAHTIVELLRNKTGRYVFISTDFVYGGEPRSFPLNENAPRQALNSYGMQKAACEDVFFAAWQTERFPAVILRPPHIVGAGSLLGTGSLEGRDPWLLWRLRNKHPLVLLDGGALLIQPVHKTDIARAVCALQTAPLPIVGGQAYNIAGPDCVTTRAYYETVCSILGVPAPDILALPASAYGAVFPDRVPFVQNRAYSTARLTRDTGFAPFVSLRASLEEMVMELERRGDPKDESPTLDTPLHNLLRSQVQAVTTALKS